MKKIVIAIAALAAFTSCVKENIDTNTNPQKEMVTISVSIAETKTVYNEGAISWDDNEALKIFETSTTGTVAATTENFTNDNGKATFTVTFPENEATELTYDAVYPASAWKDTETNVNVQKMTLTLPTVQYPTATSFDPDADLLIAKSEAKTAQPKTEGIQFRMARIAAIIKMSLTNLQTTGNIKWVKFCVENKNLSGDLFYNLSTGWPVYEESGAANYVKLDYTAAPVDKEQTHIFTTWPVEFVNANVLKIEVLTDDNYLHTKEIDIPAGSKFNEGKIRPMKFDMSTATKDYYTEVVCTAENLIGGGKIEGGWIKGLKGYNGPSLEFKVNVPAAGTYYMHTQAYVWSNPHLQGFSLTVNGSDKKLYGIFARTASYRPDVCYEVTLSEGENTIKIELGGDEDADMKRFVYINNAATWYSFLPEFKNSFIFTTYEYSTPYYELKKPKDCQLEDGNVETVIEESVIKSPQNVIWGTDGAKGFKFKVNAPKAGTYLLGAEIGNVDNKWGWYHFEIDVDSTVQLFCSCHRNFGDFAAITYMYYRLVDLKEGENIITIRPKYAENGLTEYGSTVGEDGKDKDRYWFPDFYGFIITEW